MTRDPDRYLTLAGSADVERKIQRSRFLAFAAHAADAGAAGALVDRLRREHHDARHVCSAWRLGEPEDVAEARHDDGEPSGTGGEPILTAIRGADLSDVVVAVVRYFGGIKLGTGGLGRAYGGAAAAVLAVAPRREVHLGHHWHLAFGYEQQKSLAHLLAAHHGRTVLEDYAAGVAWTIWLPRKAGDDFAAAVREATAGRIVPRRLRPPSSPDDAP